MASPLTQADLEAYSKAVSVLDVSNDELAAALESAWEEAEGYLRTAEYSLPLPEESITTTLRRKACALAEWDLFCRAGFDPTSSTNELLRVRYEDAVKWWQKVASGDIEPIPRGAEGLSVDGTPTVEEGPFATASSSTTPRGWSTDMLQ